MKRKALLTIAIVAAAAASPQAAETIQSPESNTPETTATEATSTGQEATIATQTLPNGESPVKENGEANWYLNMDYAGFNFEVPAGIVVQKGGSFVAKYPDGTFGLSMTNEGKEINQKIALEMVKRQAESLGLKDSKSEKATYGKCKGAKATGTLEGSEVTILVLPNDDQQVTTVLLAAPARSEWVNHYLRTLKK